MTIEKDGTAFYDEVKELIRSSGSHFVSVEFLKKDQSYRKMTFNPRYFAYIKGPPEPQAVITRRENNKNLANVFDVRKREARCFNMDTLVSIRVNRKLYRRQDDKLVEVRA